MLSISDAMCQFIFSIMGVWTRRPIACTGATSSAICVWVGKLNNQGQWRTVSILSVAANKSFGANQKIMGFILPKSQIYWQTHLNRHRGHGPCPLLVRYRLIIGDISWGPWVWELGQARLWNKKYLYMAQKSLRFLVSTRVASDPRVGIFSFFCATKRCPIVAKFLDRLEFCRPVF